MLSLFFVEVRFSTRLFVILRTGRREGRLLVYERRRFKVAFVAIVPRARRVVRVRLFRYIVPLGFAKNFAEGGVGGGTWSDPCAGQRGRRRGIYRAGVSCVLCPV